VLVDDHSGIMRATTNMLAGEYEVVGTTTEGRHAADLARRLEPDAIVLDVNMPGLNGFQTIAELSRAEIRAPVVFLSMLEGAEVVTEAFRSGGHGFVLKSRAMPDLACALDHALAGRRFVPSLPSLGAVADRCGHAMHVHGDDFESSLDELAGLFDLALRRGDATLVAAANDVRDGLASRLRDRGWDLTAGRYRSFDADEALSGLMRDGMPDPEILARITADLNEYRLTSTGRASSRLVMYGASAASLIASGQTEAALALEQQWTALTCALPFLSVCGYAVSTDEQPGVWSSACGAHTVVSHASDL
jgi:CheY-like chemotaxis protein